MQSDAKSFLDDWVADNIFAEGYEAEGDNSEARTQADICVAAAESEGLSRADLEAAVGDLTDYMAAQIESANDREVARLAEKDD
jgi:hypothetical protein